MNSTSELCCCGCGQVIGPRDPDPFFKTQACHRLWMWSRDLPEGEQAARRAEMRFFHELWLCTPWVELINFYATTDLAMMRDVANSVLLDIDDNFLRFGPDETEDIMRVLVYRRWVLTRGSGYVRSWERVPGWVLIARSKTDYWKIRASVATLAV